MNERTNMLALALREPRPARNSLADYVGPDQPRRNALAALLTGRAPEAVNAEGAMARWAMDNPYDAGALALSPIPVVGDVAGLANDMRMYANEPESRTALNYGLTLAGLLPFVPSAAGAVRRAAGDATEGIRAYHGSPHDFDKFSLDKIGTGEGNQTFGHGLYFAENEGVARHYRDQLSTPVQQIADFASPYAVLPDAEAVKKLMFGARQEEFHGRKRAARDYLEAAEWIKAGRPNNFSPGRMYEVNIRANPDDFLDWDRPLAEQSQAVREALERRASQAMTSDDPQLRNAGKDVMVALRGGNVTGEGAVRALERLTGSKADASHTLGEIGIPGIKYLDQGSRTAGDGTRNYVVFDDQLVEILRKYGLTGLGLGGLLGAGAVYGNGEEPPL